MANGVPSLFHFMRSDLASSPDELTFVLYAEKYGIEEALSLAKQLNLKCDRPLAAIRKMQGGAA
jgi:hypothetical protein